MTVEKARKQRDTLFAAGFVLILVGYVWDPLLWVGLVVAFSGLIPDYCYNKCPHCKKRLGRNEGAFCQHCGHPIDV